MNKADFKFTKFDSEYQDYWFEVIGDTRDELTRKYMEMCMVCVTDVVYSKVDDVVGVKQLFPFNYQVVMSSDDKLKQLLIEIVDELGDIDGKNINC